VKRFFDTEMMLRPWYRSLEPRLKCLWLFMVSRCDMAGVIDMDWELASFAIGQQVSEPDMKAMNGNAVPLGGNKILIPGFIPFQYGELKEHSPVHKGVFKVLESHGLDYPFAQSFFNRVSIGLPNPIDTTKDKDKDKDKAKDTRVKLPRKRDSIMDALAMIECDDLSQVTKPAWGKHAKARQIIMEVSPDVTPDEIKRRANNWKSHHPDCSCTSTAIASHWAKCASPKQTTAPAPKQTAYYESPGAQ
jgi:hypothetical protein